MKMLDADSLDAYVAREQEGMIFYATLSAGHALYTPAGYICVEQTSAQHDIIGVAIRGYSAKDQLGLARLSHIVSHLKSASVEAKVTEALVVRLTTAWGAA